MGKHAARNRRRDRFADFGVATLTFLRGEAPRPFNLCRDDAAGNFRIISPQDFRVLTRTGYIFISNK